MSKICLYSNIPKSKDGLYIEITPNQLNQELTFLRVKLDSYMSYTQNNVILKDTFIESFISNIDIYHISTTVTNTNDFNKSN